MLVYLFTMFVYLFDVSYPPLLPFITMTLIGGLLLVFWSTQKKVYQLSGVKLILGATLLLLDGWITGLQLWKALLLTIGVSFAIYLSLKDDERTMSIFSVFLCFIGTMIYYMIAPVSEFKHFVFIIPFVQLLFLLGNRLSYQLRNEGETRRSSFWSYNTITVLFVLVAIGAVISITLRPFILSVISTVFGAISYILGLPIYWLTLLITFNSSEEDLASFQKAANGEPLKDNEIEQLSKTSPFDYEPFLYVVIAVIIAILIIWIARKKVVLSHFTPSVTSTFIERSTNELKRSTRIKRKPPENEVRRLTYQLELKAMKYGYQREKSETLLEWYKRLPGYADEHKQIVQVYEKVRYSNKSVTEEEVLHYKACLKNLMHEMKRSKKRKENEKHQVKYEV